MVEWSAGQVKLKVTTAQSVESVGLSLRCRLGSERLIDGRLIIPLDQHDEPGAVGVGSRTP